MINFYSFLAQITKDDVLIPKPILQRSTIATGFEVFFGILGAVAMVIIALGAFQYTLSRGDPKAITKSKNTILYAVIGLIVAMSGYAIVTFVVNQVNR